MPPSLSTHTRTRLPLVNSHISSQQNINHETAGHLARIENFRIDFNFISFSNLGQGGGGDGAFMYYLHTKKKSIVLHHPVYENRKKPVAVDGGWDWVTDETGHRRVGRWNLREVGNNGVFDICRVGLQKTEHLMARSRGKGKRMDWGLRGEGGLPVFHLFTFPSSFPFGSSSLEPTDTNSIKLLFHFFFLRGRGEGSEYSFDTRICYLFFLEFLEALWCVYACVRGCFGGLRWFP